MRAELPNPDGRLKPEMFGSIQLSEQTATLPSVPAAAVISAEGKSFVWRETGPGRFVRTAVNTGPQIGDRISIESGLDVRDRVVVDGVMLLQAN